MRLYENRAKLGTVPNLADAYRIAIPTEAKLSTVLNLADAYRIVIPSSPKLETLSNLAARFYCAFSRREEYNESAYAYVKR